MAAASRVHLLAFVLFCAARLARASSGGEETPFSFSFEAFEKNRGFGSKIALYGDAEIVNSTARITSAKNSSSGRVVYEKPVTFVGRSPGFSTYFVFSASSRNGGGLAFFLAPSSAQMGSDGGLLRSGLPPSVVAVSFVASHDPKIGDLGENYVEIDFGGEISIKSSDLSSSNLSLSGGEKLHSWIDYNGTSNRLEVRLSISRVSRSKKPSISYPIDLSSVLRREKMLVGLSSLSGSGNSTQNTTLYSWAFSVYHGASYLMHSEPLDPDTFLVRPRESPPAAHIPRNYPWGILIALVFAAACGAMVTFFTLFVWFAVVARRPIAPVEYPVHPSEVVYEKIVLVKVKDATNASK